MTAAHVLRVFAVAIGIAGVADPVLTRDASIAPPIALVIVETQASSSDERVHGQAIHSANRLRSLLNDEYDVRVQSHRHGSRAAACAAQGGCIAISDGTVPERLTAGGTVIGAVRLHRADEDGVAITHVEVPRNVHLNAKSMVRVQVHARDRRGSLQLQVLDEDVLVGGTTHEWNSSDSAGSAEATVPIEWVPVAGGPRRLRVVAMVAGPSVRSKSEADVGVVVQTARTPVFMYEPEATWLGTFVRRALEADSRFELNASARLAPAVSVARGISSRLGREVLTRHGTVVITAPNVLTSMEVDLLERFVRVRGGSVVLLPDRRPTGPILRLMPSIAGERRAAEPLSVGGIRASELLLFDASSPGSTVIESADDKPVIVVRALGRGRIVTSGALDAWRYRDLAETFAQFWSALVAEAASAAGEPIRITPAAIAMSAGTETTVDVEWQTMDEIPTEVAAEGQLLCQGGASFVRLWPGPRPGTFSGTVRPTVTGSCALFVTIDKARMAGTTELLVVNDLRRPSTKEAVLDGVVAAQGGVVVEAGDEARLARRARAHVTAERQSRDTRPMRSPWWIVPFVACLGSEWWLRRRRGLR